jgi:hypothetical protein
MKPHPHLLLALVVGLACASPLRSSPSEPARADLAGSWKFRLDAENRGVEERWFESGLSEKIQLPGSVQSQGFGEKVSLKGPWTAVVGMEPWRKEAAKAGEGSPLQTRSPIFLTPERLYVGAAWYQREIVVPEDWRNRTVTLVLERPHWKTRAWVDGGEVGKEQRSLGTPHRFDLSGIGPGTHRLTVRVHNTLDPNVGEDAHSVSDQTQGNWNGIAGDISLEASPVATPRGLRIFPDVEKRSVRVTFSLPDAPASGKLRVTAAGKGTNPHRPEPLAMDLPEAKRDGGFEVAYPMGADAKLWDEFEPNLYTLTVEIEAADGSTAGTSEDFGLREWGRAGKMFTISDRVFQLRGTLECAIWPRTGYPPTDLESWRKVMKTARDFGLNHIRFHSWCPSEAAFEAADEAGIYLQVECSVWSHEVGPDTALQQWIRGRPRPCSPSMEIIRRFSRCSSATRARRNPGATTSPASS